VGHSKTTSSLAGQQSRLLAEMWMELGSFQFTAVPTGVMLAKLLHNKSIAIIWHLTENS